ncbi:hypothetical protein DFJ65_3426 [Calidifontibacter indicus]|uniref:Uncharacterized protein n=1 Tax=Calidifontibacter indicus TaxID=419650 RepID=A0A3D9U9L9_9MICO|nr:hypothetical protein DFJ65_3426 [Calidifontibacter indicus]
MPAARLPDLAGGSKSLHQVDVRAAACPHRQPTSGASRQRPSANPRDRGSGRASRPVRDRSDGRRASGRQQRLRHASPNPLAGKLDAKMGRRYRGQQKATFRASWIRNPRQRGIRKLQILNALPRKPPRQRRLSAFQGPALNRLSDQGKPRLRGVGHVGKRHRVRQADVGGHQRRDVLRQRYATLGCPCACGISNSLRRAGSDEVSLTHVLASHRAHLPIETVSCRRDAPIACTVQVYLSKMKSGPPSPAKRRCGGPVGHAGGTNTWCSDQPRQIPKDHYLLPPVPRPQPRA